VGEVALLQRESLEDVNTQDGHRWFGLHFAHREDSSKMVQYIREPPAFLTTALWDVLSVALNARRDSLDRGCLTCIKANTLPVAWLSSNLRVCDNNILQIYLPSMKSRTLTHTHQRPPLFVHSGTFDTFYCRDRNRAKVCD
jgi:hypothetical protein